MAESKEELKRLLMKAKEESEKNSAFKKLRLCHLVPSLHGKEMGKQWKQWKIKSVADFIMGGLQNHCRW